MRIVRGHKSMNVFRVDVRGLAAHSSLTPQGVNAIEHAAELVRFVHGVADEMRARGPLRRGLRRAVHDREREPHRGRHRREHHPRGVLGAVRVPCAHDRRPRGARRALPRRVPPHRAGDARAAPGRERRAHDHRRRSWRRHPRRRRHRGDGRGVGRRAERHEGRRTAPRPGCSRRRASPPSSAAPATSPRRTPPTSSSTSSRSRSARPSSTGSSPASPPTRSPHDDHRTRHRGDARAARRRQEGGHRSSIGAALEWFDIIVYASFAVVITANFFPDAGEYRPHLHVRDLRDVLPHPSARRHDPRQLGRQEGPQERAHRHPAAHDGRHAADGRRAHLRDGRRLGRRHHPALAAHPGLLRGRRVRHRDDVPHRDGAAPEDVLRVLADRGAGRLDAARVGLRLRAQHVALRGGPLRVGLADPVLRRPAHRPGRPLHPREARGAAGARRERAPQRRRSPPSSASTGAACSRAPP